MKKVLKKFLCIIISATMIFTIGPISLAEEEYTGCPLVVTVTTDKSSYKAYNVAEFNVQIKNNGDMSINNISAEAIFDQLLPCDNTSTQSMEVDQLLSGESISFSFKATVNKDVINLSFFQRIFLFFTRLFNEDVPLENNNFNDGRTYFDTSETVTFGNFEINQIIRVWYKAEVYMIAGEDTNHFSKPEEKNVVLDELTGENYVNNEILISANEGTSYQSVKELAEEYNGEIVGYIGAFDEYQLRFGNVYDKDELIDIIDKIENNAFVYSASLDYAMQNVSSDAYYPNDPWGRNQTWDTNLVEGNNWGVEAINAPSAWDHRDEMNPISIGIIDNGFDTDNADITMSWTKNNSFDNNNKANGGRPGSGDGDHGTHVAGTIAADWDNDGVSGVMPTNKSNGERLVTLFGITQNGSTFKEYFTFEMKSCYAELILRNTKVINISQGFNWYLVDENGNHQWDSTYWNNNTITQKAQNLAKSYAKPQEDFLKRALMKGYEFILICAAGNDGGIDAEFASPMNAIEDQLVKDRIIVVGAIENLGVENHWFSADKHLGYELAWFTNIGDRVDIVAPGVDIYSCVADDGLNNLYHMNGTSMAAPHVSGVAAMVWSINPNLTGAQVKEIVIDTADRPITSSGVTYNILNAETAVDEALESRTNINPWQPDSSSNGAIISRVVNSADSSNFIENAVVSAYKEDGEYVGSAMSDENGQFELIVPEGNYDVVAYKEGYIPYVLYDLPAYGSGVNYCEWFFLAEETTETTSSAKGIISDATTGSALSDVKLKFTNIFTQESVADTTTDENGEYNVTLSIGHYNVEASKDGYIALNFNVTVSPETATTYQNATISPVLGGDEYRIVLTWGENPSDLDSHIVGTRSDNSLFHVYYYDENAWDGEIHVANLDVDDVTSYGPETITLNPSTTETYKYFVHNFSGNSEGTIGNSSAQVKLYKGNTLLATYNAPLEQGNGEIWTVFEITNGELKLINKMGDTVYGEDLSNYNNSLSSSTAQSIYDYPPKVID